MFHNYCSQHQCFALNLAQGNNTKATRNLHCKVQLLCHVIKALPTSAPCNEYVTISKTFIIAVLQLGFVKTPELIRRN